MRIVKTLMLAAGLSLSAAAAHAADTVRVSLFSWPGYGFWFIAQEKNLVPDLDLEITIIEDPYESFSLMSAGALDVTSSTAEYGPIAADKDVPVKLVTYTNPSYGTDKIVMGTDYPYDMGDYNPVELIDLVDTLDSGEKEAIWGGNAKSLLKMD